MTLAIFKVDAQSRALKRKPNGGTIVPSSFLRLNSISNLKNYFNDRTEPTLLPLKILGSEIIIYSAHLCEE